MQEPQSRYYKVNNVTLHVKEAGVSSLPPIIFLHGFPSFWYSWQPQIEAFVAKGFRVVVPDQRGYNESSKPQNVSDYRLATLAEDIAGLLTVKKIQRAYLVAHDWDGIVAWALIKKYPALWHKAIIINAPYLPAYTKFSLKQLLRSWYVYFFQLPVLPEWLLQRNHFSLLSKTLYHTSLPGTFSEEDMKRYRNAWEKEGSLKGMINWYRALARYSQDAKEIFGERKTIDVPVKLLWGMKDSFLKIESGICPAKHCSHFSVKQYADATHWLPLEKSREVNEEILQFFTE